MHEVFIIFLKLIYFGLPCDNVGGAKAAHTVPAHTGETVGVERNWDKQRKINKNPKQYRSKYTRGEMWCFPAAVAIKQRSREVEHQDLFHSDTWT